MPEENDNGKAPMVTQAFVISAETREAIKEAAWRQRRSMSDLVREILDSYVAKKEAA